MKTTWCTRSSLARRGCTYTATATSDARMIAVDVAATTLPWSKHMNTEWSRSDLQGGATASCHTIVSHHYSSP